MSYALQIFVSSTCYDLRDLRATVREFLNSLGVVPLLSDEGGFPARAGIPPYVACLEPLAECPLVIGVLERKYGKRFDNWRPYPQYDGLSPVHAELRHALHLGKKVLVYVHRDTMAFYEKWRKDPSGFEAGECPEGLEIDVLHLFQELKRHDPAPWIEPFVDATDVTTSLHKKLINEIYASLREQERQNRDLAQYLTERIFEAAPEVRTRVQERLSPDLVVELEDLKRRLEEVRALRQADAEDSKVRFEQLKSEREAIEGRIATVQRELQRAQLTLVRAATKDAAWLTMVRTQFMPRQPGRVPFHNSAEVALRGYHCGGQFQKPALTAVTWSKLPYRENNLHRGFYAGLIFKGSGFAPGVTWTSRRVGESGPPAGREDYWWRLPNIYFGDYLELSTHDDEHEAPLGYRRTEFCVMNPGGERSEWIRFSYDYDFSKLEGILHDAARTGRALYDESRYQESIEHLRKAMVFSSGLNGDAHEDTAALRTLWESALDKASLAAMRFREGDDVRVIAGEHNAQRGRIEKILLRHAKAYMVQLVGADAAVNVGDNELEAAVPAGGDTETGSPEAAPPAA